MPLDEKGGNYFHPMPRILSLTFLLIMLIACRSEEPSTPPSSPDATYYLALGDSYTIGEGVATNESWPAQLAVELSNAGIDIQFPRIIAQTGWTTGNLLTASDDVDFSGISDDRLVSLLIGVNNQFQGRSTEEFQREFVTLLERAIAYAKTPDRVFVVSIPDYGVTPFGQNNKERIARELDAYNAYMAEQAEQRDIPFIDITEISRELGDSEGALASDNLHPSGQQYARWVEVIAPVVEGLLE